MIITAGIIAGSFAFATQATPLKPINVSRVDNETTRVYVGHDMTLHLSNTKQFEIIAYTDKKVLDQGDYKKSYDIKVKKGQTVYISSLKGYEKASYKIGNNIVDVY